MARTTNSSTRENFDPLNFMDMMKNFANFPMIVDRETMLKQHRKNLEAFNNCNAMALEVMKSIGQLQTQFLKQAFEEIATSMKDFVQNTDKKDMSHHTDTMHNQVKRWTDYGTNVSSLLSKSHRQMYDVINTHFQESVEDAKEMSKKTKKA